MAGTILLGYDIESASECSAGFLDGAAELHERHGVPWTIYATGRTVEAETDAIRRHVGDPRLTACQHTYSHMLLKTVYMEPGDGKPVHGTTPNHLERSGSLEEIREEIGTTQRLMRERLGVESRGMTAPWGYYRGLSDRPDILEILRENGIRWIRSDARDARDCQPTPFSVQPRFYADQGFPEILELGIQGYQDDFYWDRFDDRRYGPAYTDYLNAMLERVARDGLVWNVCSHDHGTATRDVFFETKGKWIDAFIAQAKDLGLRFLAPGELYREMYESPK